jgi:hypothetical protein
LGVEAEPCRTDGLLLEGAHHWTPTMFIRLVQVPVYSSLAVIILDNNIKPVLIPCNVAFLRA